MDNIIKSNEQDQIEYFHAECMRLAEKHAILIRRSKLNDEIYYMVYDEFHSSTDWDEVYTNLSKMES